MALFGMVAPFAGALMLRYGPRNVLTGRRADPRHAVAMGMTARWQLWLSLGVILCLRPT